MTISAVRLTPAGAARVRGVQSTHPSCTARLAHSASPITLRRWSSGCREGRSGWVRRRGSGTDGGGLIGEESLWRRGCVESAELLRRSRGCGSCGRDLQCSGGVFVADRCRYAPGIRNSICALWGTMHSRGGEWKRGVAEHRRNSYRREGTFGDDSESSEGPLNNGKLDEMELSLPSTTLLTLPTILTLARVGAVPAILAVFYCKETWATAAGAAIFILAALTDWLDGYLARKMGSSSAFGAFLDPVADKLMVAATLVLLCTRPPPITGLAATPWLLPIPTIAIIGREITMSAVREWAAAQGGDVRKAVAVNNLGKIKTASQMVSITLLLATGDGGLDSRIAGILGVALLYVAAVLALWSLVMYMKGIWPSFSK